jgi:hypothetical protein
MFQISPAPVGRAGELGFWSWLNICPVSHDSAPLRKVIVGLDAEISLSADWQAPHRPPPIDEDEFGSGAWLTLLFDRLAGRGDGKNRANGAEKTGVDDGLPPGSNYPHDVNSH